MASPCNTRRGRRLTNMIVTNVEPETLKFFKLSSGKEPSHLQDRLSAWNSLPPVLQTQSYSKKLKKLLKTFLFAAAYDSLLRNATLVTHYIVISHSGRLVSTHMAAP